MGKIIPFEAKKKIEYKGRGNKQIQANTRYYQADTYIKIY